MEYVGNKVYNNGTLSMILTGEGYITSGTTPTYHYDPFGGLFGEEVPPIILQ